MHVIGRVDQVVVGWKLRQPHETPSRGARDLDQHGLHAINLGARIVLFPREARRAPTGWHACARLAECLKCTRSLAQPVEPERRGEEREVWPSYYLPS